MAYHTYTCVHFFSYAGFRYIVLCMVGKWVELARKALTRFSSIPGIFHLDDFQQDNLLVCILCVGGGGEEEEGDIYNTLHNYPSRCFYSAQ